MFSLHSDDGYVVHPAILDACMHVILHTAISREYNQDVTFLPAHLGYFTLHHRKSIVGNWCSHIMLQEWTPGTSLPAKACILLI